MSSRTVAQVGVVGPVESARKFEAVASGLGIDLITFRTDGSAGSEETGERAETLDEFVGRSAAVAVEFGCSYDIFCALMDVADRKLRPNSSTIHLAHDPLAARYAFHDCGFEVAEFEEVDAGADGDVQLFGRKHGWPVRLRPSRWGLERTADSVVRPYSGLDHVWAGNSARRWLLETWIPLAPHVTVVLARRPSGQQAIHAVTSTLQNELGPRREVLLAGSIRERAISTARSIVDGLDATGIVTVQLVHCPDGRLIVDDLTCGPAACGAVDSLTGNAFIAEHLRAILDMAPALTAPPSPPSRSAADETPACPPLRSSPSPTRT